MVCGERLIIWKICQTAVAKVQFSVSSITHKLRPHKNSSHSQLKPSNSGTPSVFLQLSVCKELQLPASEYSYTADLVAVTSAAPLETAAVQSISVLAVATEGMARYWPCLAQEGNYTETDVDLGDLCNSVVAVRVSRLSVDHSSFRFT